jgi:hypothetical protein
MKTHAKYEKGQSVIAHLYTVRTWRVCIRAVVVETLSDGKYRVKDESGNCVDLPSDRIYSSQEAFEASIGDLAVSLNTQTGQKTEFNTGDK